MTNIQQSQSRWVYEIHDSNGNLLADLSGVAHNRKFSKIRNRAGFATFDLDVTAFGQYCASLGLTPQDLLSLFRNDLKIHKNGVYFYGGPLVYYDVQEGAHTISVRSVGYFDLLKYRHTPDTLTYASVDAGTIAMALITNSQIQIYGDFGFTQGTIDASVNRDRTYPVYKNIHDAIVQLSEVINGFDFSIDENKVFDVYYPMQGVENADIEFLYPGNIRTFTYNKDATNISNRSIARGSGYGNDQKIYEYEDTAYQNAYKTFEAIYDFPDVINTTTLGQYATGYTDIYKDPLDTIQITLDGNLSPQIGLYGIGDRVKVTIKLGTIVNTDRQWYKIDAMDITIDDDDNELVSLTVSKHT